MWLCNSSDLFKQCLPEGKIACQGDVGGLKRLKNAQVYLTLAFYIQMLISAQSAAHKSNQISMTF